VATQDAIPSEAPLTRAHLLLIVDISVKMPDKKGEMNGGWAVKKIHVLLVAALLIGGAAYAKEYAIIKDTMFGSQKIEIYQNLKEALDNYTGEGKLYEITLKAVPVKRVETKKKVEVSEFKWTVDEKTDKTEKSDKVDKGEKNEKNAIPKN
jgi:hypothetical protein